MKNRIIARKTFRTPNKTSVSAAMDGGGDAA